MPDLYSTDWQLLRKAIENVLLNAFKHCRDGSVNLKANHIGQDVVIVVSDTEVGMPDEVLERLAEPSYQPGGNENNRSTAGMGLGLAVTMEICRALSGFVEVDSRPGRGTSVSMWLRPREADPEEVEAFSKAHVREAYIRLGADNRATAVVTFQRAKSLSEALTN